MARKERAHDANDPVDSGTRHRRHWRARLTSCWALALVGILPDRNGGSRPTPGRIAICIAGILNGLNTA
jgi:hypothetical protein